VIKVKQSSWEMIEFQIRQDSVDRAVDFRRRGCRVAHSKAVGLIAEQNV
jgi:hypothetical protein